MNEIISFGEWVKHRRRLMNFTQAQLGQRVGCAAITIKKIERDERRPSQQMAELLADQLAVPQPERAQFFSMARGQLLPATPATSELRTPSYLAALSDEPPVRFVARDRELAQLHTILDRAVTGHSRMVFVSGEAGRGKTSLLAEFTRQAELKHPQLIAVAGLCSGHGDIGEPYLPFRDVLALLSGDLETYLSSGVILPEQARRLWSFLPHTVSAIAEHAPSLLTTLLPGAALHKRVAHYAAGQPNWLAQLQGVIERQQNRSGRLEQNQLFEEIRQLLQTLAAQQPLLIVVDDLQWIDSASLNLLFHLGRRFERDRIMFLCAYRGSEVGDNHPLAPVITEFKRRFGDIQIDLEQIDPVEGRDFVDALLDTESNRLGERFRQSLFQHTKGYPLFTIEVLRHLQQRGGIVRDEDGKWVESASLDTSDLPVRIEAVINQRLSRLDPPLQELLKVVAVEGEIFNAQVAAHVLHVDDRSILQRLSTLGQDHWLVKEHSEIAVEGRYLNRYQFTHILFQHYLYRQMSQGERRLLHRAVAEALVTLYQERTEEIAAQLGHHYTYAGAPAQAAGYLLIAGNQAMKESALEEAIHFYQAALSGWPDADEAHRAETLHKLGECLWMTGQSALALEALQACYYLWERLGNRIGAGAVQRMIGRVFWEQGERAISLQHYNRALSILESALESVELAQAISSISQMHMLASEYEAAISWGERALELAKRLGAQEVVAHASNNIGVALTVSTDPERGLALLRESLRLAVALNMPHEFGRASINLGESLTWHGRYAEAETIFSDLLVYAARAGTTLLERMALVRLIELDWWQGRWALALHRCQEIASWRNDFRGAIVPKVWASSELGWIYNDLGLAERAREELEGELGSARALDEAQTTVPHLGQLARSLTALGRGDESLTLIRELVALLERTPTDHACSITPLLFAYAWSSQNPDADECQQLAENCLCHLEEIEARFGSQESIAALAEARGIGALQSKKPGLAIEPFRHAAATWGALNRPYDQARALNRLGRSLDLTGERQQAQAAFQQARNLIAMLASQLEDVHLRFSFLNSVLVRQIQSGTTESAAARL